MLLNLLSGCGGSGQHAPIVDGFDHSEKEAYFTSSEPLAHYSNKGSYIFSLAKEFIGTPYIYGGHDPSGFDCSGLVQYTHRQAGISVPRTSKAQYAVARHIKREELSPGDVIFFRLSHWRVSHVGIYAGNGDFIHAPKSGQRVSISNLNTPYWRDRILKAGRFY